MQYLPRHIIFLLVISVMVSFSIWSV